MTATTTKSMAEIDSQFKNLETMGDQTVVHRKKFEFALVLIRKFVKLFVSDAESAVPRDTDEAIDEVLSLFNNLLQILKENIIQTWTYPTIENPPNFVLDQLRETFQKYHDTLDKYGKEFSEIFDFNTNASQWEQYNILDLKAIAASFTQYLTAPNLAESIANKVHTRLDSINEILSKISDPSLAPRTFSPIPVNYQSWKVDYSDFVELKEIGRGVSAHVYYGTYKKTNEAVAIKKFTFQKLNSARFQSYQREVAVLATAQHPALLRLIGATDTWPFCIITEWMDGGSLYKAIHAQGFMTPTMRTIAAFDIARGMEFLHSRKIVHRDLKSLNVLLDKTQHVKICDFGFSRFAEQTTLMTSNIGTPHWMAPEVLRRGSRYTSKVDVFAYGVVLWELLTSETPYEGYNPQQIISEVLNFDARPNLPDTGNMQIRDLIVRCWDREPDVRPSFSDIVKLFKNTALMYDGSDANEVYSYIEKSATESELIVNMVEKSFKEMAETVKLDDTLRLVEKVGLPVNIIDTCWEIVEINFERLLKTSKDLTAKLLFVFFQTSKVYFVSKLIKQFPHNTISPQVMAKYVEQLPTGSSGADTNIVIAASKNACHDLASLYATAPKDIALALEVCAIKGVEYQLKYIVSDRCVQGLNSTDKSVCAAALRCLLSLQETKRIPLSVLEKLSSQEVDPFPGLTSAAYIAIAASGTKIPKSVIEKFTKVLEENECAQILLSACCDTEANAADVVSSLSSKTDMAAALLVKASSHQSLKNEIIAKYESGGFSEKATNMLMKALNIEEEED